MSFSIKTIQVFYFKFYTHVKRYTMFISDRLLSNRLPVNFSHFHLLLQNHFSVCLLAWFFVLLENFHSYGDVTIADEELQIMTYARHSWPFSSEGSLACLTYYDTVHPFIMVIFHSHLLPSVISGAVTTCF